MTPFKPADASTSTMPVSTTASTNRTALKRSGNENTHARLFNAGVALVFLRFGDASVSASVSDFPLPAGAVEVIDIGASSHVDAVTVSGASSVYVTCGKGL